MHRDIRSTVAHRILAKEIKMSYSLMEPCFTCKVREECSDRHILRGAIHIIHSLNQKQGHLGAGHLDLVCCNYEKKDSGDENPQT